MRPGPRSIAARARSAAPFSLANPFQDAVRRPLWALAGPVVESLLGLSELNRLHAALPDTNGASAHFCDRALAALDIDYELVPSDLDRIPSSGPLLAVANHPFGGVDGLVLLSLMRRARSQVKLLGNALLRPLGELGDDLIYVDPFGGAGGAARNLGGLREALRWTAGGGALGVFPAGEVAHPTWRSWRVVDSPWSESVTRLARLADATVVPIFFEGANGPLFHLAGLAHPRFRTLMLPRELLRLRHSTIRVRVGSPIPPAKLKRFDGEREATDYLRARAYVLGARVATHDAAWARIGQEDAAGAPRDASRGDHEAGDGEADETVPMSAREVPGAPDLASARTARKETPLHPPATPSEGGDIAPPESAEAMTREVGALGTSRLLHRSGPFDVIHAEAHEIPVLLREIGRLREIAFRLVGEGTGRTRDLDRFDPHYLHLFVWNRIAREVVGAYRMGPTDLIVPRFGIAGLYTSTLFRYRPALLHQIGPALELGRSFVRPEYQRSHSALGLLWKGIGRYVADRPRYRRLFGPVSISSVYQSMSRQLLMAFLQANRYLGELGRLVIPRNRPHFRPAPRWKADAASAVVQSLDQVDDLVREIESDRLSVPVLLRQYLKLNASLLGFNIDPEFGDVLDGLMLVDLTSVERPILNRYMGEVGAAAFLAHHAARPAAAAVPSGSGPAQSAGRSRRLPA